MQSGLASYYNKQMVWFQKIYIPTAKMVIRKSEGGGESQKPNFLRESMKQNWKTKIQDFEVLANLNDRQTLNAARNENDAPDVIM